MPISKTYPLPALTDVDDNLDPASGEVLTWDTDRWKAHPVPTNAFPNGTVGDRLRVRQGDPAASWDRGATYNVRDYGVTGDGNTDDLVAINGVTALATAAGGGTVLFPAGTYLVGPTTTTAWIRVGSNTTLQLDPRATIRVKDNAGNFQTVIGAPTEGAAVWNVTVTGGLLDLNPSGNTTGVIANVAGQVENAIRFTNFAGVTVRGVSFTCCGQNTVLLAGNGCTNAAVLDNTFTYAARGTAGYDNSAIYVEAIGQVIRGNIGTAAIAAKAFGFIETHNGKSTVSGNACDGFRTFVNVVTGAYADEISESYTITGNAARLADKAISLWTTTGKTLKNVTIQGNSLAIAQVSHDTSQAWGIAQVVNAGMDGAIDGLTIAANPISFEADTRTTSAEGALSALYSGGILLGGRGPVANLSIQGNTVSRAPGAGIRVGDATFAGNAITSADIAGNTLNDCGYNPNLTSAYRAPLYLDGNLTNVKAHDNPINDTGSPSPRAGNSLRANFTLGTCTQVSIVTNPVTIAAGTLSPSVDTSKVALVGQMVLSKTTTYTATPFDEVLLVSAASGAWTLTLPPAASVLGKVLTIKKTDATNNLVTVDANASETIDGFTIAELVGTNDWRMIQSDGTNWRVLARSRTRTTLVRTTTYTANLLYDVYLCTASSGSWTLSLPTAVGIKGQQFTIIKTDNTANTVTVDPNASETINGIATVVLANWYQAITIVSDGANWWVTERAASRAGGVASVANGGTISHGLPLTPTKYGATVTVARHVVAITAVSAATLTVGLNDDAGTAIAVAENIAWWAEL